MAPSRKIARKQSKRKKKIVQTITDTKNSTKLCSDHNLELAKKDDQICSTGCTTPKAQKHQIPEILTCPPAPKKRRLVSSFTLRRPISFFDPPDIELFFASHLTSIYNRVHTHVR